MNEFANSKILIVDDEEANTVLLEKLLKGEGYLSLETLHQSSRFFKTFYDFQPDLVLLDLNMPEVNGFEILTALREAEKDIFIPVLVLTAQLDKETRHQALNCGANDFLSKPFDLMEVCFRIKNLLEARRLHLQIKEQNRILEEKVLERTAALETSHEQLLHAEKLTALGKLAASISHEFNNPILGIRNILEQIQSSMPLKGEMGELVELAIKESSRVMNLATKLKQFYRPSSGEAVPLDIHDILEDMIVLKKKDFAGKKIKLVKNYGSNLPKIHVVEDQLKQVILNLLQNSEESIETDNGVITITTSARDNQLELKVEDNGGGIHPTHLKNIFEPFFTTKSDVKGTGLGLFVSYGIIKRLGGDIQCASEVGKGTVFTMTLPIGRPDPA